PRRHRGGSSARRRSRASAKPDPPQAPGARAPARSCRRARSRDRLARVAAHPSCCGSDRGDGGQRAMKIIPGRFAGKRGIVTGASAGIGQATTTRLAGEGARVALIARRREPLEAVAATIKSAGGEALVLPADSSVESEIAGAIDAAAERWGGLDIVVSNAGIELLGRDDRVDRLDRAIWDRLITTNLTGQF